MNKETIEYITNRANESETGSIKAVSCPDIRALLEERAALLATLEEINENSGIVWDYATIGNVVRAAIMKAKGG